MLAEIQSRVPPLAPAFLFQQTHFYLQQFSTALNGSLFKRGQTAGRSDSSEELPFSISPRALSGHCCTPANADHEQVNPSKHTPLRCWLLNTITFWAQSISRFLKPFDRVLCTEMLLVFLTERQMLSNKMPDSAASGNTLPLSAQPNLKEKAISGLTEILLCSALICLCIQKKQSICKTSANKKIYSVI